MTITLAPPTMALNNDGDEVLLLDPDVTDRAVLPIAAQGHTVAIQVFFDGGRDDGEGTQK